VVKLGKRGRPKKGEEKAGTASFSKLGTTRATTLARLDRDRPDLAAKVRAGELSANAAAELAGFRRKLTPFEQIMRLLPRLTDDEFGRAMAQEQERRRTARS
jgi:hypothetical protein